MEITIQRLKEDEPFHLRASNAKGNTIDLDGGSDIGGLNLGMSPMETLLTSAGSCSAMDVIYVMRKQRQVLRDLKVSVKGERTETHPKVFTDIHLHFDLYGEIDPAKAERAVSLSVEKYCTCIRMIEKMAKITYDFTVHP
jgi:putative redox protein